MTWKPVSKLKQVLIGIFAVFALILIAHAGYEVGVWMRAH
jgi:hypothetical protein